MELPIVMMSSRAAEEDLRRGLQAGANDYVVKPMRRLELLARINTHIAVQQLVIAQVHMGAGSGGAGAHGWGERRGRCTTVALDVQARRGRGWLRGGAAQTAT